eukprot:TRINITY_DN2326_c0_g1_i1.p1 TRINITY_DN2326_c0_g1~~TRINITY_DN2326_c0_g1_i1.p1  ORF type:complete len:1588 (-),score=461.47 TRINITY_DN2326_c0_g1_i1:476-5137(-)
MAAAAGGVRQDDIERYWLPHAEHAWRVYALKSTTDDTATLEDEAGERLEVSRSKLKETSCSVQADQLAGVDDICSLAAVTEGALLHTVRIRYSKKQIYTRVARTLIAVNPFEALNIYDSTCLEKFMSATDSVLLPPHIFAIGQDAILGLRTSSKNQAVLISGESGAGKTESAKLILSYVSGAVRCSDKGGVGGVEDSVLRTNPVLEAFGNAMTVRNNNSSRFGKWIDMRFSRNFEILGCSLTSYLLEVTRVCRQAEGERCFHIFYQILKARETDFLKPLKLQALDKYAYLRGSVQRAPGVDDAAWFGELRDAFSSLEFEAETQLDVFRVVAGVLSLGNVAFDGEEAKITNAAAAAAVCELLGVDTDAFTECCLVRKLVVGSEVTLAKNNAEQARAVRDGLARLLYGRLFLWIIKQMNAMLMDGAPDEEADADHQRLLGILDIAGFESFAVNSLEQLLINLSNEHLQQNFNQVVLKTEMNECAREGVKLPSTIDFNDNTESLALIEGKGGLLDALEEAMVGPKPSESVFLSKVTKDHAKHPRLVLPKIPTGGFTVKHYAGEVPYTITDWLEKNTEKVPSAAVQLFSSSTVGVVCQLAVEIEKDEGGERSRLSSTASVASGGRRKAKSVTSSFRSSLRALMDKINNADPHYIRCIKPNRKKVPGVFEGRSVMDQLLCSGVLAAVRIRQQGYAYRVPHTDFVFLYGCILQVLTAALMSPRVATQARKVHTGVQCVLAELPKVLRSIGYELGPQDFALGSSKVFMTTAAFQAVEDGRQRALRKSATLIQKCYRGYKLRRWVAEVKVVHKDIRALLKDCGIVYSAKIRPRSKSDWDGDSLLERLGSFEAVTAAVQRLELLLDQMQELSFQNFETQWAWKVQRRLRTEAEVFSELEKLRASVDVMTIERGLARKAGLRLPDNDTVRHLEWRVAAIRTQLPLTKAMEKLLTDATVSDVDEQLLSKLKVALEEAEILDLQVDSKNWLPELGGRELLADIAKVVSEAEEKQRLAELAAAAEAAAAAATAAEGAVERKKLDGIAEEPPMTNGHDEAASKSAAVDNAVSTEPMMYSIATTNGHSSKSAATDSPCAGELEVFHIATTNGHSSHGEDVADSIAELTNCVRKGSEDSTASSASSPSTRRSTRRRSTIIFFNEANQTTLLRRIRRATDEWDEVALEENLRQAVEEGMGQTPGTAARCLSSARTIFRQLNNEDFLLESLQVAIQQATSPFPPLSTMRRLENLSRQFRKLHGFEQEANEADRYLQRGLAGRRSNRPPGRGAGPLPEDEELLELWTRTFSRPSKYAWLKVRMEEASPEVRRALSTMPGREQTMAFTKQPTRQPTMMRQPTSAFASSGRQPALFAHFKNCVSEALTFRPKDEECDLSAEEFEAAAVQNFWNLLVCLGDRPAQDVQKKSCRNSVLELAAATPALADEIFVQLMMQLTGNPSQRSEDAGWELLLELCEKVSPSNVLAEFLRAFAEKAIEEASSPDAASGGVCAAASVLRVLRGGGRSEPHEVAKPSSFWDTLAFSFQSTVFGCSWCANAKSQVPPQTPQNFAQN